MRVSFDGFKFPMWYQSLFTFQKKLYIDMLEVSSFIFDTELLMKWGYPTFGDAKEATIKAKSVAKKKALKKQGTSKCTKNRKAPPVVV